MRCRDVRGALVPNISGSMDSGCGPLRRRHSAEKAVPFPSAARHCSTCCQHRGLFMNESSRSKRLKNVVSLQVARERARQPRCGSMDMSPNAAIRDHSSGSKPRMHSFESVWRSSCSRFKHCARHSGIRSPKCPNRCHRLSGDRW
jgi:hypothetical protein